ncbi:hypothetical protein PO124_12580 [Bacillus licheniformis]|nr:hypothetical protein [Bacillus licheniformis]
MLIEDRRTCRNGRILKNSSIFDCDAWTRRTVYPRETRYRQFTPLIDWIETSELQHIDIRRVLYVLNKCIIEAVSPALWDSIERDVNRVIGQICTGERNKDWPFAERIRKLRGQALDSGEDSSRYERF